MIPFSYYAPVALHVGRHIIEESGELLCDYGSRAFVITSRFAPGFRNLALEDVEAVLTEHEISFVTYHDVEENPSVESIVRVTDRIRDFHPDFLVAIGGGSALDTAKAANVLIGYPKDSDPYQVFYGGEMAETGSPSVGVLPLLGVPTTAGSGSEVAGYAVLTRRDIGTKLRMNQLSFFTDAFLDARYIEHSPQWLLDAGALDAVAHGFESYFNVNSNPTNQMLVDAAFDLFRSYKNDLLNCTLQGEDFDQMLLAATLQGMAVVQSSTTLPHALGYPLTHEKDVPHGLASCVTLAEYLRIFREEKHQRLVQKLLKQTGFESIDELGDYLAQIITRNTSFSCSEEKIEQWSQQLFSNPQRISRHPEPVSLEDIRRMLRASLQRLERVHADSRTA